MSLKKFGPPTSSPPHDFRLCVFSLFSRSTYDDGTVCNSPSVPQHFNINSSSIRRLWKGPSSSWQRGMHREAILTKSLRRCHLIGPPNGACYMRRTKVLCKRQVPSFGRRSVRNIGKRSGGIWRHSGTPVISNGGIFQVQWRNKSPL